MSWLARHAPKFLRVNDPKQTEINFLLLLMIVGYITVNATLNLVSQFMYYYVTLPRFEAQQSTFFQIDGIGFSELAKQGAGYLIAAVFGVMMWVQWKYYTRMDEKREERNERREKEHNEANIAVANALTRLSGFIESK
jgi:hypothetical protein